MFAYRLVQVPDFSLFYADAGVKPVKKMSATQHCNRQRRTQKQKAADAAAAGLSPASGPHYHTC